MTRSTHFKFTLGAVALFAAACGQPALIDRTQPNFLKKADLLDGTWYIQETVVDAPVTPGAASFVGRGGKMEKIRWEAQEDLLVAYRAYEVVPGADPRVDRAKSTLGHVVMIDGQPYRGNPVFAYKILSHFDRQRQYNPSTGEQSNVLVEDTSDRPWYQREYMRVNWARNEIVNTESDCSNDGKGSCVRGVGMSFRYITNQDQTQQDQAPVFARDSGGKLTYFDWTTQAIIDPPSVYYRGYGNLPYCLFNQAIDCESSDVRIRTSVRRVDEAHVADYEPLVYSDKLMVKFGFFRHEAYTYSPDYYYTYSGRQFLAMRHNIWQRAHDDKGNVIPVTQRALKPIVYYLSANTPEHLLPSASRVLAKAASADPEQTIEASWDHAFRRAIAVPRGLEVADVPQMFYVCTSPVKEGDPAACGTPGTYPRLGDLRYNIVPYVGQQVGGLLGMGPSSMDPETGEVVHAVANLYGSTLDTWAGSSQQVLDVVSGELPISKLITGQDIKDYVFANLNPTDPRRPADGPWNSQQPLSSDPTRPMSSFANTQSKLSTVVQTSLSNGSLPQLKENRRAVVASLLQKNPTLENELLNLPEVRIAAQTLTTNSGFLAKLSSDNAFYTQVARDIINGTDPLQLAREDLRKTTDPAVGCFYEVNYDDEDYVGEAKSKLALQTQWVAKYKAAGKDDATALSLAKSDIYNLIRREAYRSVAEHEIGHTLGLRHNFIASADALNFKPGYWDLRKDTIGVQVGGSRVLPVTPQNLLDASKPNQRQIDGSIYEYQYSSIMDYGARVTAMNKGVGRYDDAAILFGYAGAYEPGWVEVFNQTRTDYDQPNIVVPVDNSAKVFTVRGAQVEIPLAQVEHYTPASTFYTDRYHYSTLPFHFADQQGSFNGMLDQGIARMNDRSFRKWSEMTKHYDRIAEEVLNYTLSQTGLSQTDYDRAKTIINAAGGKAIPIEVPYMFCTDSEVGANLMCNLHDQGADVFEMTSKWIERFNQNYVFSNFRRDRLSFSPSAVASSKFSRYLGNIPNVYQQWLFNIYNLAHYYSLSPEEIDKYYGLGDPIWQNYWTMAVTDSTNLLMQQLSIPSVGYYGKKTDGTWEYVPTGDSQNRRLESAAETALAASLAKPQNGGYSDILYLPRGPARSMFTVYDNFGYDNFTRVNEAGHFWDTYAAMLALTTSETNFLGVDRGSDALRYSLPYYLTFNLELAPLFNNFWTQNSAYFAPAIAKQADGTGLVQLPVFLKAQDYVQGFNYPPIASAPVDSVGNPMTMAKATPVSTWSARFYAQVWSMAYFTANYDLEFANYNQVFRLGSGDNLTPSPGFSVVTYDDPFGGGYTYAAVVKTGTTTPPAGPAMVTRAAQYRTKWDLAVSSNQPVDGLTAAQWEAKVRDATRTLEMMRGLYDIFGKAW